MIEVRNLTKEFGPIKAVNDVSFVVEKGEILGFLGPNGAGKSTTMRMITGFIPPTAGTAVIGGCDILGDSLSAREKIGYLPENAPVYPDMTVSSYLDFCAEIRGYNGSERKDRVGDAIAKCFLESVKYQSIGTLSKGYKQRVCFAQSIIHDPEYLILDEPTDGLDPNQKHEVRLMIRNMSSEKAIILSTHILDEVDAVCTRAIIIAGGKVVADDTPYNLRARSAVHGAVSLTLGNPDQETLMNEVRELDGVKTVKILDDNPNDFRIRVLPEDIVSPLANRVMSALSEKNYEVKSIFVEQGRLDDVFRSITAGEQAQA